MQENNKFIAKMTGKGEVPIENMIGFHPPDDAEHEAISKKIRKKIKREKISSCLWAAISLAFVVLYVYLIVNSDIEKKEYLVLSALVFCAIAFVCIYKVVFIDTKIIKVFDSREYQLKDVNIHHLMPGFGVSLGKSIAKVSDINVIDGIESGHSETGLKVYNYEFDINRELKKVYRKNHNAVFTLISMSLKDANQQAVDTNRKESDVQHTSNQREKKRYMITYLYPIQMQEEDREEGENGNDRN